MDGMGTIKLLESPKIWFSTQEFEHVCTWEIKHTLQVETYKKGAPLVIR